MWAFWMDFLVFFVFLCVAVYLYIMASQLDMDDDKQKAWIYANYGVASACVVASISFFVGFVVFLGKKNRGEIVKNVVKAHKQIRPEQLVTSTVPVQTIHQPVQYVPQPTAPQIVQHVHTINPN